MSLGPGVQLGPYEVTSLLGSGGMGEVYRARDTKLNRDVALKVLPEAFTVDVDRLARFKREAQVLASLNHPNIGAIYGFEESADIQALVLELVEGPTLADRIAQGPVPLDEALPIARQIAEALEAAHEQSIIHRDLKPANIKLRPDGTVKVLDFGLAKLGASGPVGSSGPGGSVANSPTITSPALLTGAGVILGTAAYMSPEQARGRPADHRSDIWAFGVVLYEMLTGRRAFDGDDVSITLASVLKDGVDLAALPSGMPAALRRLLRRCLEKDPRRRLSSMADARLELDDALSSPQDGAPIAPGAIIDRGTRGWMRWAPWLITALASAVAATFVALWNQGRTAERQGNIIFEIGTPERGADFAATGHFAFSPDGRALVARVLTPEGPRLWLRHLDRLTGSYVPGTEDGTNPFWSPDGRYIGFFAGNKLRIVDPSAGNPRAVADATQGTGGTWTRRGTIVFAPSPSDPLFSVAESGGPAVQVTELDRSRGEVSHRHPVFLDDERFLYLAQNSNQVESAIYAGSLTTKQTTRLVNSTGQPLFARPDHLLFSRESSLMAQRLDLSRMALAGNPIEILSLVAMNPGTGAVSARVSNSGALVYRSGLGETRNLTWFDRSGKAGNTIGSPDVYENPRLSPDTTRLAVFRRDPGADIWIFELVGGGTTRLTSDAAVENDPLWSPDGKRIAFISNRDGGVFNLYVKSSGGAEDDEVLLLKTPFNKRLNDWSADGRYILYEEEDPKTRSDLWVLPLFGDRQPQRVLGTRFNETRGAFSPDGHWIAYTSDETGGSEVYVQTFPTGGGKWPISTGAGSASSGRWRADGKELFFDSSGRLTAVDLTVSASGRSFKAGAPRVFFRALMSLPPHNYDVTPAGDRFLAVTILNPTGEAAPLVIETNWRPPERR